jgi:phage-related baseplate assembly protein
LAESSEGLLEVVNSTMKNNLKIWINQYKMLNDTVDILDGKIVNLGINFVASTYPGTNKYSALQAAVASLRQIYTRYYDIGEPFMISTIYDVLKRTGPILDVTSVNVVVKTGTVYSNSSFDLEGNTAADGTMIHAPSDTVFEIKYPNSDIKGTIN